MELPLCTDNPLVGGAKEPIIFAKHNSMAEQKKGEVLTDYQHLQNLELYPLTPGLKSGMTCTRTLTAHTHSTTLIHTAQS